MLLHTLDDDVTVITRKREQAARVTQKVTHCQYTGAALTEVEGEGNGPGTSS